MRQPRRLQTLRAVVLTSVFWIVVYTATINLWGCSRAPPPDPDEPAAPGQRARPDGTSTRPGAGERPSQGLIGRFLDRIGSVVNAEPDGPGEMGRAVVVPRTRQKEAKEKFSINQFNLVASDLMSLNRSLPDFRMAKCQSKAYPSSLPDTSVVIVFHNEAWSTLLRTIFSVWNRTPAHLLREIILIDDSSTKPHLAGKLERYLKEHFSGDKLRLVRMPSRSGLIRARLRGAALAKGQTITFLDAHCEATKGWLEPLVAEVHRNRRAVVCPIIDIISEETFEYVRGSDLTWGGFNWKMNFRWFSVPDRENKRRNNDRTIPLRTPTIAGGLFTIDRNYFYEIGSYDPGMEIWGGENLEISFRVWMCGGELLIVTCSRVGHVFRKSSPYSWPGGVSNILSRNIMRTVAVWMDGYKEFYLRISPSARGFQYGDITDRLALRKKLHCHSFQWYLQNIYPESAIPFDYFALGEIRHKETGLCLDTMGRKMGEAVGMIPCHSMGGNQVFAFTNKRAIQADMLCLDISSVSGPVKLYTCHGQGGNQLFTWKKDTMAIHHDVSDQCLGPPEPHNPNTPSVGPCTGSTAQQWLIQDMQWEKYRRLFPPH